MITQTITASFLAQIPIGTHDLSLDSLKMALYLSAASIGASTTVYTDVSETSGTGYTPGGVALTNVTIGSDADGSFISFDNPAWPSSSFTARGALIYNASKGNKSIAVLDFGSDKEAGPNFTVVLPANTASTALIRLTATQESA